MQFKGGFGKFEEVVSSSDLSDLLGSDLPSGRGFLFIFQEQQISFLSGAGICVKWPPPRLRVSEDGW